MKLAPFVIFSFILMSFSLVTSFGFQNPELEGFGLYNGINYSNIVINETSNQSEYWITDQGVLDNPSEITSNGMWTKSGTNIFQTNLGDNVGIGTNSPNNLLEVDGNDGNFSFYDSETGDFLTIYIRCGLLGIPDACFPSIRGQSLTPYFGDTFSYFGIDNQISIIGVKGDPSITLSSGDDYATNSTSITYQIGQTWEDGSVGNILNFGSPDGVYFSSGVAYYPQQTAEFIIGRFFRGDWAAGGFKAGNTTSNYWKMKTGSQIVDPFNGTWAVSGVPARPFILEDSLVPLIEGYAMELSGGFSEIGNVTRDFYYFTINGTGLMLNNWSLINKAMVINGSAKLLYDNNKFYFGEAEDVALSFDGSDMIIEAEVGSPNLNINGFNLVNITSNVNVENNLTVNGGFSGSCVNVTYQGGIAIACND